MECKIRYILALPLTLMLTCCTLNPFTSDNKLTGSVVGTGIGAGAGVAAGSIAGFTKANVALTGVAGAAIGYYVTTLRFASGGVLQGGGQVFTLGKYAAIEIPTDSLFDSNSDDLLDQAPPILDSAVMVLERFGDDNIVVSGNTSGFGTTKNEQKLSEARARQVAAYLWAHGISVAEASGVMGIRNLSYVGYGNYFPIANNIRNEGIRQSSRIQITAYPTTAQLHLDKAHAIFNNIGSTDEPHLRPGRPQPNVSGQFPEILHEEGSSRTEDYRDAFREGGPSNSISASPPEHTEYYHERPTSHGTDMPGNYNDIQREFSPDAKTQVPSGGYKDEIPR